MKASHVVHVTAWIHSCGWSGKPGQGQETTRSCSSRTRWVAMSSIVGADTGAGCRSARGVGMLVADHLARRGEPRLRSEPNASFAVGARFRRSGRSCGIFGSGASPLSKRVAAIPPPSLVKVQSEGVAVQAGRVGSTGHQRVTQRLRVHGAGELVTGSKTRQRHHRE